MKYQSNRAYCLLACSVLVALAAGACDSKAGAGDYEEIEVPPKKWKMQASGAVEGVWASMDGQARQFDDYSEFMFADIESEKPPIFKVKVPGLKIGKTGTFAAKVSIVTLGRSLCEMNESQGLRFTIDKNTKSHIQGTFEGSLLCDSRPENSVVNIAKNTAIGKEQPDEPVMEPTEIRGEFSLGSPQRRKQ